MKLKSVSVTEAHDILGTFEDGTVEKIAVIRQMTVIVDPYYAHLEDKILSHFGPMLGPFLVNNLQ